MGADLYYKGQYAFRDSYNKWSIFRPLDLSWWRDVVPMCDERGNLSPEKAKELREILIDKKRIWSYKVEGVYLPEYVTATNQGIDELIGLLTKAIEENSPIECSL